MKESAPYGAGSFVSNLVSKIIAFFCCTNQKYSHCLAYFFDAKNTQTRTNTRKARNHKGCGSFTFMVELRGVEPLKMGLNSA